MTSEGKHIYDLDGTLIPFDSFRCICFSKNIGISNLLLFSLGQILCFMGIITTKRLKQLFHEMVLKGRISNSALDNLVDYIMDHIDLSMLERSNAEVIIISASPDVYVSKLAPHLSKMLDRKCTCYGSYKNENEFVELRGRMKLDFLASVAVSITDSTYYGDSSDDDKIGPFFQRYVKVKKYAWR